MAKPLGLASEAELSTSPCERHRDVDDCVLVEVSLAHAKVFQELVWGLGLGLGFYRIKCFTIAIVSSKLYTWPSP